MARWGRGDFDGGYGGYGGFAPYVSVAERQRRAAREMDKLRKQGQTVTPVVIEGRKIATSFWGQSWCTNLEGYADFASRLERGRTYVRNGSVVDLQVKPGAVEARVAGSELYVTTVKVKAVPAPRWAALRRDCAGGIDSLVELLQGRLSKGVMERICRRDGGLFPSPSEISFDCSCPDHASMCKHVAAVLYGIGARLDRAPELLFTLRAVDHGELIAGAARDLPLGGKQPAKERLLVGEDLAALFGFELAPDEPAEAARPARPRPSRARPAPVTKATRARSTTAAPPSSKPAKRPASTSTATRGRGR